MSWNLPGGLTGAEDTIAGPRDQHDTLIDADCVDCAWAGAVAATRHDWRTQTTDTWECPNCGTRHTEEADR